MFVSSSLLRKMSCVAPCRGVPGGPPELPDFPARCPYRGDNYQPRRVPVGADVGLPFPSRYQRFVVSTFTFVDDASRRMLTGPVGLLLS